MSNIYSSLRLYLNLLPWVLLALVVPSFAQIIPISRISSTNPISPTTRISSTTSISSMTPISSTTPIPSPTPISSTTPALFQWGFTNYALSMSLPNCYNLSIAVKPLDDSINNTLGTPPYYMMAFVLGGTSRTTFIGTDATNLNFVVTEPIGSQLALTVIDANGRTGGISPTIYTVTDSQFTQCVTTPLATPEFKITTNVTTELSTCQPWGFVITGGVPPYIITLQAVNSGGVTNQTIPFGYNNFTYINRAPPNTHLVGAVSDLTGRWANGTAIVRTIGSNDANCTGLVSISGNSTISQQEAEDNDKRHSKQRRQTIILVSVVIPILIGLSVAGLFYIHKRIKRAKLDAITPRPLGGPGRRSLLSMNSIKKYIAPAKLSYKQTTPVQPRMTVSILSLSPTSTITSVPKDIEARARQDLGNRSFSFSSFGTLTTPPPSMYSFPMAGFASFPLTSIRSPQNRNEVPRAQVGILNQNRRVSGVEARSIHSEPALSDSGSNVLPRVSLYYGTRGADAGVAKG